LILNHISYFNSLPISKNQSQIHPSSEDIRSKVQNKRSKVPVDGTGGCHEQDGAQKPCKVSGQCGEGRLWTFFFSEFQNLEGRKKSRER
jgi:hypothetical protein